MATVLGKYDFPIAIFGEKYERYTEEKISKMFNNKFKIKDVVQKPKRICFTIESTPGNKFCFSDLESISAKGVKIMPLEHQETTFFIKTKKSCNTSEIFNILKNTCYVTYETFINDKYHWSVRTNPQTAEQMNSIIEKVNKLDGVDYAFSYKMMTTVYNKGSIFLSRLPRKLPKNSEVTEVDEGIRISFDDLADIPKHFDEIKGDRKIKIGVPFPLLNRKCRHLFICNSDQLIEDRYYFTDMTPSEVGSSSILPGGLSHENYEKAEKTLKEYHICGDLRDLILAYFTDDSQEDHEVQWKEINNLLNSYLCIGRGKDVYKYFKYLHDSEKYSWEKACQIVYLYPEDPDSESDDDSESDSD